MSHAKLVNQIQELIIIFQSKPLCCQHSGERIMALNMEADGEEQE